MQRINILYLSETNIKYLSKEAQILVDNDQLSHLSLMKPPGSLWVIPSSHWDSVSAATVVTFSHLRRCRHHRLNEVPLCLKHIWPSLSLSLSYPFTPFRLYMRTWTDGKYRHAWHGVTTASRSALGLVCKEKRKKWLSCIHVYTLKCHSIPTPTSLWVHILLVLLWKKKPFPSQEGPFDPRENPVFVPLIWGSVMAQTTMATLWCVV